jgi:hypothetical protein
MTEAYEHECRARVALAESNALAEEHELWEEANGIMALTTALMFADADGTDRHHRMDDTGLLEPLGELQALLRELQASLRETQAYLGAVLGTTSKGSPADRALPQATVSPPPVDKQPMTVTRCARPRRRTGRRNRPHAPSLPDEGLPSHPIQLLGGLYQPTPLALA